MPPDGSEYGPLKSSQTIPRSVDMKILKKVVYLYNHMVQALKKRYDEYVYTTEDGNDGIIIFSINIYTIEKNSDLQVIDNILWSMILRGDMPTEYEMVKMNKIYKRFIKKYEKKS